MSPYWLRGIMDVCPERFFHNTIEIFGNVDVSRRKHQKVAEDANLKSK